GRRVALGRSGEPSRTLRRRQSGSARRTYRCRGRLPVAEGAGRGGAGGVLRVGGVRPLSRGELGAGVVLEPPPGGGRPRGRGEGVEPPAVPGGNHVRGREGRFGAGAVMGEPRPRGRG